MMRGGRGSGGGGGGPTLHDPEIDEDDEEEGLMAMGDTRFGSSAIDYGDSD